MTQATLRIDSKGRIFIPKRIREQLFKDCSMVECYIEDQSLTIKKKQMLSKELFMQNLKNACESAMMHGHTVYGIDFSKYEDVAVEIDRRSHDIALKLKEASNLSVDKHMIRYSELLRQVIEHDPAKSRERHFYNAYEYLSKLRHNEPNPTKIDVDQGITLDEIETILADGFAISVGFTNVDFNELEYHDARQKLVEWLGIPEDELTRELVQAQMLADGKVLVVTDEEDEEHMLTLGGLVNAIKRYCKGDTHAFMHDLQFGTYDSNDYNNILQIAIFDEVIYG